MRTGVRFVAAALVGILLAGVMPPVARAQQPAQPPAQQPAPQPGQPVAQQPAQQPGMMQEQMKSRDDDWDTVANIYNVAYVPGKVVLCGLGGVVAVVVMAVSFGTAHKSATAVVREGCGGSWALSADDVRPTAQEDFYTRNPADR